MSADEVGVPAEPTEIRTVLQERIIWWLVAVGVALRMRQLAGGASLWLDEIALARNIAERDYAGLLQPLRYSQVAPVGFLLVERLFWRLFHTDWSLRVVPYAGAIASLFLLRSFARRNLDASSAMLAVGALALALPHIMYAGQVKQYSTDVTWALALLLLASRVAEPAAERSQFLVAGVVGVVAVWFSNAAVLVVTGLGGALTLLALLGRTDRRRTIALVVVPWAVAAGAASLVATRGVSPQTMTFMTDYWKDAFAPMPPRSVHDLLWPWSRLTELFGSPIGLRYPTASVFVLLSLAGFVVLWRTRWHIALLLLGPILVTFGVAAAHLYPFETRLVLFITPFLLVAMAAALSSLAQWIGTQSRAAGAAVLLVAAVPIALPVVSNPPTYRLQEMDGLLEELAAKRRPDDVVYVWYRTVPNMIWYGPRHGFGPRDFERASCQMQEPRGFLRDVDRLRGHKRVWMILTLTGLRDARLMLAYTDSIGILRQELSMGSSFPRYHLEARLYDFSDSTRLASTSAATFPVALPRPEPWELLACEIQRQQGELAPTTDTP